VALERWFANAHHGVVIALRYYEAVGCFLTNEKWTASIVPSRVKITD